jgi:hypothetical protein
MLREYAVDPKDVVNGEIWTILCNSIGFSKGRFISEIPKSWIRKVHDAIEAQHGHEQVKKLRLVEQLNRLKSKGLLSRTRKDHPSHKDDWLKTALMSHRSTPFDAIICTEKCERIDPCQVFPFELSDDHALWKIDTTPIPRTAERIAARLVPLARRSSHLKFVDPYLNSDTSCLSTIRQILLDARSPSPFDSIEFHGTEKLGDSANFIDKFRKNVIDRLSTNIGPVSVHKWKNIESNGDKVHARFFMTELAGMHVDYGFAAGKPEETLNITFMPDDQYAIHWHEFAENSTKFDCIERFTVPPL